jgi:hypothetical protein
MRSRTSAIPPGPKLIGKARETARTTGSDFGYKTSMRSLYWLAQLQVWTEGRKRSPVELPRDDHGS